MKQRQVLKGRPPRRNTNWKVNTTPVFWGKIASCDHVVQIYENDEVLLDTLNGFAGDGLQSGDAVVVVATDDHLNALNKRLEADGVNVKGVIESGQYLPLNAAESLSRFMVFGWPNEEKFTQLATNVFNKVKRPGRKIRAFGEMVALLWAQGYSGATVQLELLWNNFCKTEDFCLFCAYPKSGFTANFNDSIRHICSAHTKVISGEKSSADIVYKSVA